MHCWFCESPLRGAGPGEIYIKITRLLAKPSYSEKRLMARHW
jgi:hypothetical protein